MGGGGGREGRGQSLYGTGGFHFVVSYSGFLVVDYNSNSMLLRYIHEKCFNFTLLLNFSRIIIKMK